MSTTSSPLSLSLSRSSFSNYLIFLSIFYLKNPHINLSSSYVVTYYHSTYIYIYRNIQDILHLYILTSILFHLLFHLFISVSLYIFLSRPLFHSTILASPPEQLNSPNLKFKGETWSTFSEMTRPGWTKVSRILSPNFIPLIFRR